MKKTISWTIFSKRLLALSLALATVLTLFAGVPVKADAAAYDIYYFPKYTGSSGSIVTGLKAIGVDSSYSYRSKIAAANNISGYTGTAAQNTKMVNLLKQGKLINPDIKVSQSTASGSDTYYRRYTGSSNSIVSALKAIGVDSSYNYRSKIAAANNISGYKGTAAQNTKMVNLLKQGKLINPDAAQKHTHSLQPVAGSDNVRISYCCCGYFEARKQGVVQQNSVALPNNGYIVSPAEIAVALAALKGTAAGIVSLASNPYVIIPVVVSGIALYAYVNCNSTTGEVVDVKQMSSNYKPQELKDGKFYYSAIYRGKTHNCVMILYNDGININQAKDYMVKVARNTGILQAEVNNLTIQLGSVYTPQWTDAKKLCQSLKNTGNFKYGGDKCADEDIGYNKSDLVRNVLYYEHFHLYCNRFGFGTYEKVNDTHVFFGIPYTGYSYNVA